MSFLIRMFIGVLKGAALVWVFLTVRRYFGTMAMLAEISRRMAGLMGWSRGYALLSALKMMKSKPATEPPRTQ